VDGLAGRLGGQVRLVSATYLLVCVLVIYKASAFFGPEVGTPVYGFGWPALGLGVALLAIGISLVALPGLESWKVGLALLAFGIVATILSRIVMYSSFYLGLGGPVPCSWFSVSQGFPIPWYYHQLQYIVAFGPRCLSPTMFLPVHVDWYNFISDVLCYIAVPIVGSEMFQGFSSISKGEGRESAEAVKNLR